ncbi:MAG: GTPase Era [Firmicutes bacterium]|nr:GTPase Era [Bacillota bacterium]
MLNCFNQDGQPVFTQLCAAAYSVLNLSGEAAVEFCEADKQKIQSVNLQTRGIDKPTDVLSFPNLTQIMPFTQKNYPCDYDPELQAVLLGSIMLCTEIAQEAAARYGHSFNRELNYLFVHGLLHLLGYNHETESDKKIMRETEEKIIAAVTPFKSGFISILGKPNVGKSSLMNALMGEKVSIVSPKSQTTRDSQTGIYTSRSAQMIFIDTPGVHVPKTALGKYMCKAVDAAAKDADAVVIVLDATKRLTESDTAFIEKQCARPAPVYVAVNKTDLAGFETTYPILSRLSPLLQPAEGRAAVKEIIPVSAKTGENLDKLRQYLLAELPPGPQYYPSDQLTDKSVRYQICEIIREKALYHLHEEIPHGIGVAVQKMEESHNFASVEADIVTEKDSHKLIIIGENGSMLKTIGEKARLDIQRMLDKKVYLKLFVKVRKDWRNKKNYLEDILNG